MPSPRPRNSGSTHTPWIWLTLRDWDPISALKMTRPSSNRAQARPASMRPATRRR
ncbi:Uncharacterised protein [Mycobacteroides abscessus subsp. abscessus]|nr:Uncharacterised protein [Mycobacteroides abscessus subsp. abscessus]